MRNLILFCSLLILGFITKGCGEGEPPILHEKEFVLLEVDYTTNEFLNGSIFEFGTPDEILNFEADTILLGDFGSINVRAIEIDTTIFAGTMIWMGLGNITTPSIWENQSSFPHTDTEDFITPTNGFNELYIPSGEVTDYESSWASIQSLNIVRAYLRYNPNQKVQVLLYTPSIGPGDPSDWRWIFILQK